MGVPVHSSVKNSSRPFSSSADLKRYTAEITMSSLVIIHSELTYSEAAQRARELAEEFSTEVKIHRSGEGWSVVVPAWVESRLEDESEDDRAFEDWFEDDIWDYGMVEPEPYLDRFSCEYCNGFGHSPLGSKCPLCLGEGEIWR